MSRSEDINKDQRILRAGRTLPELPNKDHLHHKVLPIIAISRVSLNGHARIRPAIPARSPSSLPSRYHPAVDHATTKPPSRLVNEEVPRHPIAGDLQSVSNVTLYKASTRKHQFKARLRSLTCVDRSKSPDFKGLRKRQDS